MDESNPQNDVNPNHKIALTKLQNQIQNCNLIQGILLKRDICGREFLKVGVTPPSNKFQLPNQKSYFYQTCWEEMFPALHHSLWKWVKSDDSYAHTPHVMSKTTKSAIVHQINTPKMLRKALLGADIKKSRKGKFLLPVNTRPISTKFNF